MSSLSLMNFDVTTKNTATARSAPSALSDITDSLHKFGSKMIPGIFLGHQQVHCGGWSGDLLAANASQVENAEGHSDIHGQRSKAEEVHAGRAGEHRYCFPLAEGMPRQPGLAPKTAVPCGRRKREAEFPEKGESEDQGGQIYEGEQEAAGNKPSPDDGLGYDVDYWSLTD